MAAESNTQRLVRTVSARATHLARRWRSGVLVTSGMGFLSASAWTFNATAGLAAVGLSLLVLDLCGRGKA